MVSGREQAQIRAEAVKAAVATAWGTGLSQERGDLTLVFDRQPVYIRNKRSQIIGVDAMVRLFRGANELPIDPHRILINPPTVPRAGISEVAGVRVLTPDPLAAFTEAVWDSVLSTPNAQGWRTRGTVTTVYATAPGGHGSAVSVSSVYATARTSGSLDTFIEHLVGQWWHAGPLYDCYEIFLIFDTSSIPDLDGISSVVLSAYSDLATPGVNAWDIVVAASSYNGGAVVTTDWVNGANLAALEQYASLAALAVTQDAYNAFTSTGRFASAINKTGNTALMGFSSRHQGAVAPTTQEFIRFNDADAAGTTIDAKLEITHAEDPAIFAVAASGDDGHVNSFQEATYPPSVSTADSNDATVFVYKIKAAVNFDLKVGLVRWDTSSIPDDAIIDSATLRLYIVGKQDADGRSLTAEWYNAGVIGTEDYATVVGTDAHAGTTIASIATGALKNFDLINISNVSKTGYTGLRLHISGGEPIGFNYVEWATFDNLTLAAPRLIVNYHFALPTTTEFAVLRRPT